MDNVDIKELRRLLMISQEQLARLAGVNVATIQYWENENIPQSRFALLNGLLKDHNEGAFPEGKRSSEDNQKEPAPGPNKDEIIEYLKSRISTLEWLLSEEKKKSAQYWETIHQLMNK